VISTTEIKAKTIIENLGFIVKSYAQLSCIDPANTIYSQVRIDQWIADFALINAKILIEIDGGYWHGQPLKKIKDNKRDKFLRQSGWQVIRISADMIEKFPDHASRQIYTAILSLLVL